MTANDGVGVLVMLDSHPISVDLSPHLNNAGIASAVHRPPDGLDGLGTTFYAESLPASGTTITCQGTPFIFPDKGDGLDDNIACEAQEIALPKGAYRAIHILGMCDWRAFEEPLRLKAPNGTYMETPLGLSDASHYQGLQYGEHEALACPLVTPDSLVPHVVLFGIDLPDFGIDLPDAGYEMKETHMDAGIWHQVIPVEPPRPLVGLVLPDNPSMHLFALTLIAAGEASL